MKKCIKLFILIIALLQTFFVYADVYVVGVNDKNLDRSFYHSIGKEILLKLIQGDSFLFYDLKTQTLIASISIPNKKAFSNKKYMLSHFSKEITAIRKYFESNRTDNDGYFLFPQFLNELSVHIFKPEEKKKILIIGNAIYHDKREPHFSMTHRRFPSDGNLIADIRKSVYSTKNKQNYLDNSMIHFVYTNEWETDIHKDRVNRFWNLFTKSQGGKLISFTHNVKTGVERFMSKNTTIVNDYNFDESDREITMISLIRDTVKSSNKRHKINQKKWLDDGISIYNGRPKKTNGKLKIGIKWKCKKCDYDLWVKSDKENKWLFYGNKRTNDGYFNKDYLNSPHNANSLEYVAINRDIDITKLEIKVNLYRGNLSSSEAGEVRAYFNDNIYLNP